MLDVLNSILFRISPLALYTGAGLIMCFLVMPRVITLFRQEKEYIPVATLLLIIATTMSITSTIGLLFLACYLYPCTVDTNPFRDPVRLIFAVNIFSSAVGFLILFYLEDIKKWLHGRKYK